MTDKYIKGQKNKMEIKTIKIKTRLRQSYWRSNRVHLRTLQTLTQHEKQCCFMIIQIFGKVKISEHLILRLILLKFI